MEHKGFQFRVVQTANPTGYKWTVDLGTARIRSGKLPPVAWPFSAPCGSSTRPWARQPSRSMAPLPWQPNDTQGAPQTGPQSI